MCVVFLLIGVDVCVGGCTFVLFVCSSPVSLVAVPFPSSSLSVVSVGALVRSCDG